MEKNLILILKALSDENRVKIFKILKSQGNRCACDLLADLDIVQSTLSHHMKILVDSGLIDATKNGKWITYSINQEVCSMLRKEVLELFDGNCCGS